MGPHTHHCIKERNILIEFTFKYANIGRCAANYTTKFFITILGYSISTLNVIMMLRGWGVEAMMLRTIACISCLILPQNLDKTSSKCDVKRKGEGGSELNVTMTLSIINSIWRCSLKYNNII